LRIEKLLYSNNLLGDTLLQTPALRTWKTINQEGSITYHCATGRGAHWLLQHNPYIDLRLSEEVPDDAEMMDAAVAFNIGAQSRKSLAWGYGVMLGVEIDSLKYDYTVTEAEELDAEAEAELLGDGKPIVLVARHSASCTSNDPNIRVPNKCAANRLWVQVAKWLLREGFMPVAVGGPGEEKDSRYFEWPGKKLYGAPLRTVAALTTVAAATLSVDTGIRHLAAAAGGNMYCISGRIPLWLIQCEPVRDSQKIYEEYKELPYVTAQTIIEGAKKVLT
jgi:ADP-heptose:LPS heptosyltransferase